MPRTEGGCLPVCGCCVVSAANPILNLAMIVLLIFYRNINFLLRISKSRSLKSLYSERKLNQLLSIFTFCVSIYYFEATKALESPRKPSNLLLLSDRPFLR